MCCSVHIYVHSGKNKGTNENQKMPISESHGSNTHMHTFRVVKQTEQSLVSWTSVSRKEIISLTEMSMLECLMTLLA